MEEENIGMQFVTATRLAKHGSDLCLLRDIKMIALEREGNGFTLIWSSGPNVEVAGTKWLYLFVPSSGRSGRPEIEK